MKTTFTILATLLTLHINLLFAGNDVTSLNSTSGANTKNILELAPLTPREATFEDVATTFEFSTLAPRTPFEATFGDEVDGNNKIILAPVTPVEADFSDTLSQ
jgi:hypothetical protein